MRSRRHRNRHGVSAWLVTWESHEPLEGDRVAAVFSPRLGAKSVRAAVHAIYAATEFVTREKIRWAIRPDENPYPAMYNTVGGVRWEGQILCGHNPFLFARLVDELRVEQTPDGTERAVWVERPLPDFERILGISRANSEDDVG
jgi:hypothetical protein